MTRLRRAQEQQAEAARRQAAVAGAAVGPTADADSALSLALAPSLARSSAAKPSDEANLQGASAEDECSSDAAAGPGLGRLAAAEAALFTLCADWTPVWAARALYLAAMEAVMVALTKGGV